MLPICIYIILMSTKNILDTANGSNLNALFNATLFRLNINTSFCIDFYNFEGRMRKHINDFTMRVGSSSNILITSLRENSFIHAGPLRQKWIGIGILFILEWTTSLDTSSRTLFVREGEREDVSPDVHVTSNVELRNNVRLLLNVELRNYVISRQIVI